MKGISIIVIVLLFILFAFVLAPMIFLWGINSLAESGGAVFYIPHTVGNYFVCFVFIGCFLAGSHSK